MEYDKEENEILEFPLNQDVVASRNSKKTFSSVPMQNFPWRPTADRFTAVL